MRHMNYYLYDTIMSIVNKIGEEINESIAATNQEDENDKEVRKNEQQVMANKITKLTKMANSIQNNGRKKSILNECGLMFNRSYKDFAEKLDTKKHLIGFDNGVYDLERCVFRASRPDDYIRLKSSTRLIMYNHGRLAILTLTESDDLYVVHRQYRTVFLKRCVLRHKRLCPHSLS